jgi:hypothetical protein
MSSEQSKSHILARPVQELDISQFAPGAENKYRLIGRVQTSSLPPVVDYKAESRKSLRPVREIELKNFFDVLTNFGRRH